MKKKWSCKYILWLCLYSAVRIGNLNFGHLGDLTKGLSVSFVEINSWWNEKPQEMFYITIWFFNFDMDTEVIFIIFIKCPWIGFYKEKEIEGAFFLYCVFFTVTMSMSKKPAGSPARPRPRPRHPPLSSPTRARDGILTINGGAEPRQWGAEH